MPYIIIYIIPLLALLDPLPHFNYRFYNHSQLSMILMGSWAC